MEEKDFEDFLEKRNIKSISNCNLNDLEVRLNLTSKIGSASLPLINLLGKLNTINSKLGYEVLLTSIFGLVLTFCKNFDECYTFVEELKKRISDIEKEKNEGDYNG